MYLTALPVAALFLSIAHGAALQSRALPGQATFYGGNLAGGACMFTTYTLPSGVYGTALSDSNWDTAANCGACVQVTGPNGNTLTAMIVDECPGCGLNHLDLFPDAFAALANPNKGVIPTTWSYVDCPINSPLQLHNKDGVSQYWFSMQVVNAEKAVNTLEVSTNGGSTWTGTTRMDYNFFQYASGFGTATVDVKVTSVDGDVVIVKNVEVSSGSSTTAATNFGPNSGSASSPPPPPPVAPGTPSSTSTPPPATSTTQKNDNSVSSQTTDSAVQLHATQPTTSTTNNLAVTTPPLSTVTSASIPIQSTVTVYSYEGCPN